MQPADSIAVLTLAKGRQAHLCNMLAGLARNTRLPDLCVVADLNEEPAKLPSLPFPVRQLHMPSAGLPLAAARNAAARAAGTASLIFLDVDCIPAQNLVAALASDLAAQDALICCDIRYLPAGATDGDWDEHRLRQLGQGHPVRPFPTHGLRPEPNTGLFWSLAFAMRAASFNRIGGFDEAFTGYGAEDTDLGFRAQHAGVPLLFTGSTVAFHQYHAVYDPPLQHVADIAVNAWRFRQRHGFWPMRGWLDAFADMGLIEPPGDTPLQLLRAPTDKERCGALRPPSSIF